MVGGHWIVRKEEHSMKKNSISEERFTYLSGTSTAIGPEVAEAEVLASGKAPGSSENLTL